MRLVYRVHKGTTLSYKSGYVQADGGKVIAAEEGLAFTVGWTVQKLRERALGKGYTVTLQTGLTEIPRQTAWGKPAAKQLELVL